MSVSLSSLLNTSVAFHRKSPSKDTSGGQTEGYAAVPGLTDVPALVQPRGGKAVRTLGQRQVLVSHAVYVEDASEVQRGDRVYEASKSRWFTVHGVEDMAGQGTAWRIDCVLET